MKKLLLITLLVNYVAVGSDDQIPTLINARPASPADFPASVNTGGCTATIVSEYAVSIAAHCIFEQPQIRFTVGASEYRGTCTHPGLYPRDTNSDYAMCETNAPVTGIPYENINSDPGRVRVNDTILLTGYGCIKKQPPAGWDGIYRVGEAKVERIPTGSSNIFTTLGGSVLCPGDSGGPAFHIDNKGERVLIATNSYNDSSPTRSYITATHTEPVQKFFRAWISKTGHPICGISEDAKGCRDQQDTLAPPSEFTIDRSWIKVSAKFATGYESFLLSVQSVMTELLDAFEN